MAISEDMNSSEDIPTKRKNNTIGEDNKSPKRRRDADQRILDQFWLICDPNPFKRNKSLKIIIEIISQQNETSDSSGDLIYCLERVIRGMASARQFARHGFCVLLTQLLSIFESKVSLDLVSNLSEKHLGKMDELSNHDSVIGWALVMGSVIKSQRLKSADEEIYSKTFDVLYTLGMKKPYIELVVCELFDQFVTFMAKHNKTLFSKIVSNKLKEDLETENKYKPFFVFVSLIILEHFPRFPENKGLKFMLKNESFQKTSIMIRESTSYHPTVHPFHKQLIKRFIKDSKTDFENFWNNCIDNVLFTPNQIEKGFLGFELIKISLQLITTTDKVSTILSPSFVRLFIQSLSVKTHPLHSASQQLCEFFINFIKTVEDSDLQLEIVNSFTKQPGSLLFDDISKSKFFSNLLRNLNSTSIRNWTQKLKTIFLTTNKLDSNDILRIRCIQQISNISKSLTSVEWQSTEILWTNIQFLFFHSYFETKQNSKPIEQMFKTPVEPIGEKLRNSLKDGFRTAFNLLLHLGSKTSKEKLTQEVKILSSMIDFVNQLVSSDSIECLKDSNSVETFETIVAQVLRLRKKLNSNSSKETEIKIFISLYSMLSIQLFEEYEEIQSILPDLNESMKRALKEEVVEDNSSPIWSDVLTDLILSILTTPSKLTKNVLFSCFKHICCQITNNGIQRLVDAIIPSNDNKLFAGNEDSDEDEEEDDEEVEDEEMEDGDSERSESEDEIQNTEIDEKFRNDVINALGPAAHNDDDEESVYLSDNEMFQIDETLATVFKAKFADKKGTIEKRNSITAFRIRCLELIQILLSHKDISLDQVFVFIEPIVSVAKSLSLTSKQNQLSFKAIQLISQMTKIKDSGDNSLEITDFKNTLNYLLNVLTKTIHLELQKALIPLISWIITLSKKLFPKEEWYYSDIETALKSFFEKNNCQISSQFFKTLITVHNEIGFKLYDTIFEYAFKEEIRPFKRSDAIEMILILCKTKTNENSISRQQMEVLRDMSVRVLCKELIIEALRGQYVSELLKLFNLTDKHLKQLNSEIKISENEFQELCTKLKALSKKKKKKLTVSDIVRKIISNQN